VTTSNTNSSSTRSSGSAITLIFINKTHSISKAKSIRVKVYLLVVTQPVGVAKSKTK